MGQAHSFHSSVLREYDIRGVVGETLSAADANAVGRAFATLAARRGAGRRICVGYDGRLSSPELERALVAGLAAGGVEVLRVGLGPTPMLYFAVHHLDADGGVMVTGSHNPPDQNGFKFMMGKGPFFGADIVELGRVAAAGADTGGEGKVAERPVFDAYVARLARDYAGDRPLKVAWDAGNGAAGEAMARLVERLPGTHILLNETIDGTFPAHHPDPTVVENLAQIIAAVNGEGCDLGIAFDGDGDRIGVIDERGRVLWGDQLLAILAADVLRRRPGATIIADVKASQVLFDEIERLGGVPLMWRTGHSLVKSKMMETGSPLAGEMSGHIFFADGYYGFDDALYAAVRLLSIVARSDQSLGAMRDRLPAVVNTPELRFACPEERKVAVVDEVRGRLRAAGAEVNDIDGVRVTTADGWWLLRASNTQAVLVARCEASDATALDRLKADLAAQLEASGVEPPPF
ncbi:MAG: phosphomannomutase/phosphoglucomutase [Proteobacteria bacterium]|nr:phosphomannomutase/phosphoglucomutase [Pseudomonadota bacterium]